MFACTDFLIEREGQKFFYGDSVWFSETADGVHNINMSDYPDVFFDTEGEYSLYKFYSGTLSFPLFEFIEEDSSIQPIEESWKQDWARHSIRRRIINEDLAIELKIATELKKTRKAILSIINYMPELKSLNAIQEYVSMSEHIDSKIAQHSKDTEESEVEATKYNESDPWSMGVLDGD